MQFGANHRPNHALLTTNTFHNTLKYQYCFILIGFEYLYLINLTNTVLHYKEKTKRKANK